MRGARFFIVFGLLLVGASLAAPWIRHGFPGLISIGVGAVGGGMVGFGISLVFS